MKDVLTAALMQRNCLGYIILAQISPSSCSVPASGLTSVFASLIRLTNPVRFAPCGSSCEGLPVASIVARFSHCASRSSAGSPLSSMFSSSSGRLGDCERNTRDERRGRNADNRRSRWGVFGSSCNDQTDRCRKRIPWCFSLGVPLLLPAFGGSSTSCDWESDRTMVNLGSLSTLWASEP